MKETATPMQQVAERWHDWVLATQAARLNKRRSSSMQELRRFYADLLPVMDDIVAHLNRMSLAQLPARDRELLALALAFIEVAIAVELFGEPDESTAMPADRFSITEGAAAAGAYGHHESRGAA